MAPSPDDRRREPRLPASGEVALLLDDAPGRTIHARLVDLSPSGFRARHDCAWLGAGQEVAFHRQDARGRARVMWTRVASGAVETGFLVMGVEA